MGTVNQLAHGGTTTSTQPVFQNTAGNMLGGAMAGGQLLSALGSSGALSSMGSGLFDLINGGSSFFSP